jgi:hypothetical protein
MLSSADLSTPMETDLIELAERQGHGVKVRLLWRPGTDEVLLEVNDDQTGANFEVQVPGDRALDAFEHPFVYVSSPGAGVVAPDAAGAAGAAPGLRRTS